MRNWAYLGGYEMYTEFKLKIFGKGIFLEN
jgi:hypothetical protein